MALVSLGTASAKSIYIRYGSNNTIEAELVDFQPETTYTLNWYADGVIQRTDTRTTDINGNHKYSILNYEEVFPSKNPLGYYICVPATESCSDTLYSKYFLSIPDKMKEMQSILENRTEELNDIIFEFRNETNITALRNEWGTYQNELKMTVAQMNDTVKGFNDTINTINDRIQKVNTSIPSNMESQISALNSKIDTAIANLQANEQTSKKDLEGKISSVQTISFITLLIVVIAFIVILLMNQKGKLKLFGKRDNGNGKESQPQPIIVVGKDIKQEDIEKIQQAMSKSKEENLSYFKTMKKKDPELAEKLKSMTY